MFGKKVQTGLSLKAHDFPAPLMVKIWDVISNVFCLPWIGYKLPEYIFQEFCWVSIYILNI